MENNIQLKELKKAILFLKRKERIRNNTDVAKELKISSSYLSQMLHGNKPFTETFFKKFETSYNISLNDPFSYTDLDWVAVETDKTKPAPDNNKELFGSMKKLLHLKDEEIENQKKLIQNQQQLITTLQKEIDILRPLLK
ncbi:MAG TPA: hypothetical protein PK987_13350 [Ferruginibacter sp.]|nr:hypothetical protein [Ferruginibacter sp.]